MKMSGAQAIIACLLEQQVDTVFGYPGGTVLPLYDALQEAPLQHILTVHEQGAAHAADGYARASGKPGVCIATSGPGATNLVTGLAAAFMDSVPVVAITGQVSTSLIGRDAFQEIDITGITMPITKHNFRVKSADKLVDTMRQAFRIARRGRPGPVLVDVPQDVQKATVEFTAEHQAVQSQWQISDKLARRIAEAAESINRAKQPVIVVGGGVIIAEAYREVRELAEKCSIPVASTLMGLGAFPASHALFLGLTGMHGRKEANQAVHDADVMIAVGSRFSDRVTGDRKQYSAGKTVIHIDIDPAEIDKNVAAHIGLAGEIRQILRSLLAMVQVNPRRDWLRKIAVWQDEFKTVYETEQLTAPWIMKTIADMTKQEEYLFVTDVGQHQMWAAQHLAIEKPRTWLTSGGLGAMGFGLPAAMGAQLAMPDKRVIHLAGDGGFKMTGSELYTVAVHELPIISIIINNHMLGMIHQLQHVLFDKRYTACKLPAKMDFAAYAGAFGIQAATVDTPQEFGETLNQFMAVRRPGLIVANIPEEEMVTPMISPGTGISNYVNL